mmetsp:Transcript_3757/g.3880  ORF Transcript_3757/g.3880 Transcript_3757/m.3880 type:complete len:298 (+) Transcript_3757:68-961(+)
MGEVAYNMEENLTDFISLIPSDLERTIITEMIISKHYPEDLLIFFRNYEKSLNTNDVDDMEYSKCILLRCIVQSSIDYCHKIFIDSFEQLSTEKAKLLVKTNDIAQGSTNIKNSSLVYGDIDYFSFAHILQLIDPQPNEIFTDLGHGTGRALICTHLLYGSVLKEIRGIELLPELQQACVDVLERYQRKRTSLPQVFGRHTCTITAELGNILDDTQTEIEGESRVRWTESDIVFANSTCFDDSLMISISHLAEQLKPGAKIITLTKPLSSTCFEILDSRRYAMSWGAATCYIHRKKI